MASLPNASRRLFDINRLSNTDAYGAMADSVFLLGELIGSGEPLNGVAPTFVKTFFNLADKGGAASNTQLSVNAWDRMNELLRHTDGRVREEQVGQVVGHYERFANGQGSIDLKTHAVNHAINLVEALEQSPRLQARSALEVLKFCHPASSIAIGMAINRALTGNRSDTAHFETRLAVAIIPLMATHERNTVEYEFRITKDGYALRARESKKIIRKTNGQVFENSLPPNHPITARKGAPTFRAALEGLVQKLG